MSSYKSETRTSTIGEVVADGFSMLEELASSCREIVDNASEGLSQTQRIQTLGETADTLEGISAEEVPEAVAEATCTYSEMVPTRKGRGVSRAVQRDNAVSMLQAGVDEMNEWLSNNDPEEMKGLTAEEKEAAQEASDDVEQCISTIEDAIGEAEGCEFPGMFG